MKVIKFLLWQVYSFFPFLPSVLALFKDFNFFKAPVFFYSDLFKYLDQEKREKSGFPFELLNLKPYLYDRFESAGSILTHYFHQDIWAAGKVHRSKVKTHYDVGSRLDGFISHCLVFCKVVMLDLRPLDNKIANLDFIRADCTNMKNIKSSSIDSISSLHAIEHFGLGRYGDKIDPRGFEKAIKELKRVIKKGGNIYFSVPIGKKRLEFNAHRIFDPRDILKLFSGFKLVEFSAVDDKNSFIKNAEVESFSQAKFSCGLYHFRKV